MTKQSIHTDNAPAAIGTYSQAIAVNDFVFLSGQIPLDPATMEVVDGDFEARARQVFDNLAAVAGAAGGTLDDVVKLTVFLTDLVNFASRVHDHQARGVNLGGAVGDPMLDDLLGRQNPSRRNFSGRRAAEKSIREAKTDEN